MTLKMLHIKISVQITHVLNSLKYFLPCSAVWNQASKRVGKGKNSLFCHFNQAKFLYCNIEIYGTIKPKVHTARLPKIDFHYQNMGHVKTLPPMKTLIFAACFLNGELAHLETKNIVVLYT